MSRSESEFAGSAVDDERAKRLFPATDHYRRRARMSLRRPLGEPVTGEVR
jgi:hypothetical protein